MATPTTLRRLQRRLAAVAEAVEPRRYVIVLVTVGGLGGALVAKPWG